MVPMAIQAILKQLSDIPMTSVILNLWSLNMMTDTSIHIQSAIIYLTDKLEGIWTNM